MITVQRARGLRQAQRYEEIELERLICKAAAHTDHIIVDSSRMSDALHHTLLFSGFRLNYTDGYRVDDNRGLKISWERI